MGKQEGVSLVVFELSSTNESPHLLNAYYLIHRTPSCSQRGTRIVLHGVCLQGTFRPP